MQRKRSQWIETISGANAEHQIYLDESGINTNLTRHYAHAVHGNVPWMLPRSTRLPEQLFCHPYGLMAVWYILRTKVEQLHSDFVNIWENN